MRHRIVLEWDDEPYRSVEARARIACRTVEEQLTWESGLSVEYRWLDRLQFAELLRVHKEGLAQIIELLQRPPEPVSDVQQAFPDDDPPMT